MALGTIAGITAGIGALQTGIGLAGMLFNKRPEYKTPSAIDEIVARARKSTTADMPGYEQQKAAIDTAQANAIETAKLGGDPTLAASSIQSNTLKSTNQLAAQLAQYKSQQEAKLAKALQIKAQDDQMKFQMNEFAPYADKAAMAKDNILGGIKTATGSMTQLAMLEELKDPVKGAVDKVTKIEQQNNNATFKPSIASWLNNATTMSLMNFYNPITQKFPWQ